MIQNENGQRPDSEELEEQIAYLPDGTKVRIEYLVNNLATCRRLEGEWKGRVAVCTVGSLKLAA